MSFRYKKGDRIRVTKPVDGDLDRYKRGDEGTIMADNDPGCGGRVLFDKDAGEGKSNDICYLYAEEMELIPRPVMPKREVRSWDDPAHDAEVMTLLEIGALYALVDESYSNGHDFGVMECVAWKDRQQLGGLFQSLKRKGLVFDGDNPLMIDGKEVTQYTLCEPLKAVIR